MYSKQKSWAKKNEYVNHPNKSIAAPSKDFEVKYNCRVRYYPDNQIKVTCFSKAIFNPDCVERRKKPKPEKPSIYKYDPITDSMSYREVEGKTVFNPLTGKIQPYTQLRLDKERRGDNLKRSIDKAFEIGLSNDFQYFVTLTLDKNKIDRYNKSLIYKKLRSWLCNKVQRNQMDYILFPEYHKLEEGQTERAIHFHALVNAQNLNLVDSGRKTETGQTIYNLDDWKYGFSTVIELDGRTAVVRYVMKYISKENESIFDRAYLSGGKTLKRHVPQEFLNMDYASFEGDEYYIPAAKMSVKYKTFNLGFDIDEGNEGDGGDGLE